MFNDKYGLTKAVLEGKKTMTRRAVPEKLIRAIEGGAPGFAVMESKYKVGEVVAVAQSYLSIHNEMMDDSFGEGYEDAIYDPFRWAIVDDKPGWSNKMFVRADLMPHQIRITNVRVERLQDISNDDCIREGIGKSDVDCITPFFIPNIDYEGYLTARHAFKALINRLAGKGTWESNPWVFVYEFELVK